MSGLPDSSEPDETLRLDAPGKKVTLNLGTVDSKFSETRKLRLFNGTAMEVAVDRFKSSCDCTTVEGLPVVVPAGATKEILLATDLSHEPDFTGSLAVEVEMFERDERRGVIEVLVTVE